MAYFYRMTADTNLDDFVRPGEQIRQIAFACQTSSFQFLDHKPMIVEIAEDGGLIFPDFLILDAQGVDNLFYKPIDLVDAATGIHEEYTLALPPRIRAVREAYMRLLDEDGDESEGKELIKDEYGIARYRINASAVGNYRIFKLADVWDYDIIVTHSLKEALAKAALSNVDFSEVEED